MMESAERSDLVQVMVKWQEKFDQHTVNEDARNKSTNERIDSIGRMVKKDFSDHTKDEMVRFKAIQDGVSAVQESVALIIQQQTFDHSSPCVHLRNTVVNEDWNGHHDAHKSEMEWAERARDFKWYILKAAAAAATISLIGWVGVLIWSGILHGPVK